MITRSVPVLSLLAVIALPLAAAERPARLRGFQPERAAAQETLERQFDRQLDRADFRRWIQQMSAEPNHVGSPHNRANAEFTLARFRDWGWDAQLESFYVLCPAPLVQRLELISPTTYVARLSEPPIAGDATSARTQGVLPPYNIYGADGDVTADLVYVNQGTPDDYEELAQQGVSVKGRIVIARYGGCFRGLKPKLAHEHGAVGCIIYSDPRDDGYAVGEVYPRGGFRPVEGVQRDTVVDLAIYPGDPLTPGVGATKDAKRLAIADASTVQKIPVLPISYADAQPLLQALAGPIAPPAWRGALPITYHLGPGPARVHLKISSSWNLQEIRNVIATIRGREFPDEWVIRGNHHDAWAFGAWDPMSGHAAMMAEAKAIGALVRQGWRPRRTLVYASWDAEETGIVGSTEWVEAHAEELRRKAVLYVNSDTNTRGFLRAGGSPALQELVSEVAGAVRDPQVPMSVLQRLRARFLVDGSRSEATEEQRLVASLVESGPSVPLVALGSGTDFTAFQGRLGIPVLSLEYGGEDQVTGCYHSIYDSFEHYERFGDPGYAYGVALAQTIGRVVLRTAESDVLPFQYGKMAEAVARCVDDLKLATERLREKTSRINRLVQAGAFSAAADPAESSGSPDLREPVPAVDFSPLERATVRLGKSARACDESVARAVERGLRMPTDRRIELEALMQGMDQTLTDSAGLPGHPWYRHMIYAPGLLTGYGVKTLPSVREAIEAGRWREAEKHTVALAGVLDACAERLDQVTRLLGPVQPATP